MHIPSSSSGLAGCLILQRTRDEIKARRHQTNKDATKSNSRLSAAADASYSSPRHLHREMGNRMYSFGTAEGGRGLSGSGWSMLQFSMASAMPASSPAAATLSEGEDSPAAPAVASTTQPSRWRSRQSSSTARSRRRRSAMSRSIRKRRSRRVRFSSSSLAARASSSSSSSSSSPRAAGAGSWTISKRLRSWSRRRSTSTCSSTSLSPEPESSSPAASPASARRRMRPFMDPYPSTPHASLAISTSTSRAGDSTGVGSTAGVTGHGDTSDATPPARFARIRNDVVLRGAAAPPHRAPPDAAGGALRFQGVRADRFHAGRAGLNPSTGGSIAGGGAAGAAPHIGWWYGSGAGGRIICSFMVWQGRTNPPRSETLTLNHNPKHPKNHTISSGP
ncbi:hypothetical protein C2845_PM04G23540 [Panicum miliaceum]|uniref:Uncharacterized protein n=1 Tax=Panicum miliaceum TaxID=4540 RepID=A0A3L6QR15_PANMI|nr:hypothetical protein C2845_PM04G23540 [Panicum miliaceum]